MAVKAIVIAVMVFKKKGKATVAYKKKYREEHISKHGYAGVNLVSHNAEPLSNKR
jgi:IS5 family transposase